MTQGEGKNKGYQLAKLQKMYKIEGDKLIRTNEFCPACGPGVFLAKHQDRVTCGRCGHRQGDDKEEEEEE